MSLVGNGDVASVLPDRDDLMFFASGVSNSQETRASEFRREAELLLEQRRGQHAVYFGSLAVFYSQTPYTRHKMQMEDLAKEHFSTTTIVRIGNISWGTNPNTLINHFRGQVERGEKPDIRDEYRYVVDQDEFLHWIGMIPTWAAEINIPGRRMKVEEIFDEYAHVGLNSKAV